MRLTRKLNQDSDYLASTKKTTQFPDSPSYKENIHINKIQNKIIPKDYIFNENVPIKVRLIKAAHLNPNINFTKIHKKNKSALIIKKEKNDKIYNLKESNTKKSIRINKTKNINKLIDTNKFDNEEESHETNNIFSNNSNIEIQGDIYILKKLLITSKILEDDNNFNK